MKFARFSEERAKRVAVNPANVRFVREPGDRMGLDIWADPMDDGDGSPFVCVPHPDAPPPTT